MTKTRFNALFAVALLLGASACGAQSSAPPVAQPAASTPPADTGEPAPPTNGLAGRAFLLDNADGYTPARGPKIRIEFSDDNISFHAGCNAHAGSYRAEDGKIDVSWPGLATTMMACIPHLDAQDAWIREFLLSKPAYQIDGNNLTLKNDSATLTFVDRVVADPDRQLVGPKWTIDALITGDAVSSIGEVKPSILFGSDGSVAVETGCNMGRGKYEVSGSQLTFGALALTRRACISEQLGNTEKHIQKVVGDGTATYRIEAARLTVQRPDGTGIRAIAE